MNVESAIVDALLVSDISVTIRVDVDCSVESSEAEIEFDDEESGEIVPFESGALVDSISEDTEVEITSVIDSALVSTAEVSSI